MVTIGLLKCIWCVPSAGVQVAEVRCSGQASGNAGLDAPGPGLQVHAPVSTTFTRTGPAEEVDANELVLDDDSEDEDGASAAGSNAGTGHQTQV